MNRIILIGNGFDLAHGLKTSYKDFIDDYFVKIKNNIKVEPTDRYDYKGEKRYIRYSFENESISFLQETEYSFRLDDIIRGAQYKNKFLETVTKKFGLKNWVDIEEEYYFALKSIINNKDVIFKWSKYSFNPPEDKKIKYDSIDELNECFNQIEIELAKYLKQEYQTEFKESVIKSKDIYRNLLMIIGSNFKPKDFTTIETSERFKPRNILFLNFNYTPTEGLYYGPNAGINAETIHIHGELFNDKNPIIFGYGDELDEHYQQILKNGDNRLLENVKSIKYAETDNYKRMLNFINSDEYQVLIMGHSCGNSDRTLLNTLFEHKNCQSIKIFYYEKTNEKGEKSDNFSDIYRNITRNFTNFADLRAKVVDKTNSIPLPQIKS